jgi:hypothetical protein
MMTESSNTEAQRAEESAAVDVEQIRETIRQVLAPALAVPRRSRIEAQYGQVRCLLGTLINQDLGDSRDATTVRRTINDLMALSGERMAELTDFQLWERTRLLAHHARGVLAVYGSELTRSEVL